MRQLLGGLAHLLEVFRIGKELGYRVGQVFAGQVRFFQQDCGAFSLQGLRR